MHAFPLCPYTLPVLITWTFTVPYNQLSKEIVKYLLPKTDFVWIWFQHLILPGLLCSWPCTPWPEPTLNLTALLWNWPVLIWTWTWNWHSFTLIYPLILKFTNPPLIYGSIRTIRTRGLEILSSTWILIPWCNFP